MLGLMVTLVTAEQFQKKPSDVRCKMAKVIADWEKSGDGSRMPASVDHGECEFDGDNHKAFPKDGSAMRLCVQLSGSVV